MKMDGFFMALGYISFNDNFKFPFCRLVREGITWKNIFKTARLNFCLNAAVKSVHATVGYRLVVSAMITVNDPCSVCQRLELPSQNKCASKVPKKPKKKENERTPPDADLPQRGDSLWTFVTYTRNRFLSTCFECSLRKNK